MMQSNNPYKRVDDGIGAGLVSGAVIGGAAAAGFHRQGGAIANRMATTPIRMGQTAGTGSRMGPRMVQAGQRMGGFHAKNFGGSGRRKALAYGAAALGGAILGGSIDGMRN